MPDRCKPGRIPCLNPRCRRTAPADKHPAWTEIVCGKCWKLLPRALTARYQALRRRERAIERRIAKRQAVSPERADGLQRALWGLQRANWLAIRARFFGPARSAELDAFMREMNFDD